MISARRASLLLVVACAAVAAGCGNPAVHHPSTGRAAAPPGSTEPPFRWLVRTRGPQPSVAEENGASGTTAWRLPGPRLDVGGVRHGAIAGYVAAEAVRPGDIERIYIDTPGSPIVEIRVFRIGWYHGTGGREVLRSRRIRSHRQPPCTHRAATGLTACRWRPALTFTIPPALPTGIYIARLTGGAGSASDCLFVVRARRPQPLLAQLPTATYQAYNAWGGDSLYPGGRRVAATGTSQGIEVSLRRPYDSITGAGELFARDIALVRFLERYGYGVSYTTSASVDADPRQVLGHRAFLDFGHSEYWSQRQADAFRAARRRGTSLLFLSSDTLAWRIRYVRTSPRPAAPDAIVAYKEYAGRDPDRRHPTGAFADRGAGLTGSAYAGCITPRLPVAGPPQYRYFNWAPLPTLRPRWLFRGTGLHPDSRIAGIVGYEIDGAASGAPPGTSTVGTGAAVCMGTRGDARDPQPGPSSPVAVTTLSRAASGALTFATGTLGWELGLDPVPSASPDAPRAPVPALVRVTRNLLARVLAGPRQPQPERSDSGGSQRPRRW